MPLLQRLAHGETGRDPRAVILSPTREIALQTKAFLDLFGRHVHLRSVVTIGGVPLGPQTDKLRKGVDIVVATPGRLIDHMERRNVRLDGIEEQSVPVIVAGRQALPVESRIWQRSPIIISTRALGVPSGAVVVVRGEGEWPDPPETARALAERGFLDVLLEGGPNLATTWWGAGLIGQGVVYVGALIAGGRGLAPLEGDFATMAESRPVNITDVRMVGPDMRIEFHVPNDAAHPGHRGGP